MAKQLRHTLEWAVRAFRENGLEVIDLAPGLDLESIKFVLQGAIDVSTAYTSTRSEGLAKLIKRVEIVADGQVVSRINGEMLTHGNFARSGGVQAVVPGFGIASNAGEVTGFLDFSNIGGMRAKDSIFRTSKYKLVQIRIQYGALTDMYVGAGVGVAALDMGITLRMTKETDLVNTMPPLQRDHQLLEKSYPSSMSNDRIPIDIGWLYRGMMLRSETDGQNATGVINRVQVMSTENLIYKAQFINN